MGGNVVDQVLSGEATDVFLGSQNSPSQGCTLECSGVQMIQYQFFLVLVDLRHFSQDNIAFAIDGGLFHLGVEEDIRNDFDSLANVLLENLGKVGGLLT